MKDVDLGGPTSFFDHVYLGCTQRECQTSKDIVDNYPNMFESRISAGAVEKLPVSEKSGANIRHGPMTSKVMQRSAWKEIANWQTKQLNSNTKSQHHAMTTTNLKKKWDLLENCLQFALSLWNACTWLVLDDLLVVRKQTCSCSHEMDWSLWQTCSAFDLQHSSHMLIHTKLLCGKHGTTMQIRIVSRFWFCGRPWRLKINIRKTLMHFRKSNICTNKLDVQETDISLTQLDRSWTYFSVDWILALDLWDLVIEVFHSSPNQINKTKDVREPQGNLSRNTTLHM